MTNQEIADVFGGKIIIELKDIPATTLVPGCPVVRTVLMERTPANTKLNHKERGQLRSIDRDKLTLSLAACDCDRCKETD